MLPAYYKSRTRVLLGGFCLCAAAQRTAWPPLIEVGGQTGLCGQLRPHFSAADTTCSARCNIRVQVYRLRASRGTRGHEQGGPRFEVVVQSDQLTLSTWLVAPTSTSARSATFRSELQVDGRRTRVLAEQTAAVGPARLGESIGQLSFDELRRLDAALRLVLDL
jgi:mRNA interferase MazF